MGGGQFLPSPPPQSRDAASLQVSLPAGVGGSPVRSSQVVPLILLPAAPVEGESAAALPQDGAEDGTGDAGLLGELAVGRRFVALRAFEATAGGEPPGFGGAVRLEAVQQQDPVVGV